LGGRTVKARGLHKEGNDQGGKGTCPKKWGSEAHDLQVKGGEREGKNGKTSED